MLVKVSHDSFIESMPAVMQLEADALKFGTKICCTTHMKTGSAVFLFRMKYPKISNNKTCTYESIMNGSKIMSKNRMSHEDN